jgi:hypothetical protein
VSLTAGSQSFRIKASNPGTDNPWFLNWFSIGPAPMITVQAERYSNMFGVIRELPAMWAAARMLATFKQATGCTTPL